MGKALCFCRVVKTCLNLHWVRIFKKVASVSNRLGIYINYFLRNRGSFKYSLSLGTMVYNEASYLAEWIEYHKLVGVDKFYIYDNYSTDNIKEVLQSYIASGEVEYKLYPESERHGLKIQKQCFNEIIKRTRNQTKWLGILDVDEFLVPVKGSNVLTVVEEIIRRSPAGKRIPAVGVYWAMYGYSGNRKKPDGLVIENYRKYCEKEKLGVLPKELKFLKREHIKSIVNPRMVVRYSVHGGRYLFKRTAINELGKKIDKKEASTRLIRINHYWTKSYEEFAEKLAKNHQMFDLGGDANMYKAMKYSSIPDYDPEFLSNNEDRVIDKYIPLLKKRMGPRDEIQPGSMSAQVR